MVMASPMETQPVSESLTPPRKLNAHTPRALETVCIYGVHTVSGFEPVRVFSEDEWQAQQSGMRLVRDGTRGPVLRVESISDDGSVVPGGIQPPFFEIW